MATCIHCTVIYMAYLQRDEMPKIQAGDLADKEDDVWKAIEYLSMIKELGKRANKTASQLSTNPTLQNHLKGFKAIIDEIMNDTCNWVSHYMSTCLNNNT